MNEINKKTTPKDFFLHIGATATLYISTVSVIALWFKIIDEYFTDPLVYSDPYSGGISLALASLLVIFPIFISLLWVIRKNEIAYPEKVEVGIRRWVVYFTLFLSGLIIVVDLVTLLNRFLSGREITGSFFAKVLVIIVIVGAIFAYYLMKARNAPLPPSKAKFLTYTVSGFVVLSIVCGFLVMGSPKIQRMKRFDEQRVYDLQDIQWQVATYFRQTETLPQSLDELSGLLPGYVAPTDPETGVPYEYNKVDDTAFEVCATFNLSNKEVKERKPVPKQVYRDNTFLHGKGKECFKTTLPEKKSLPPIPVF